MRYPSKVGPDMLNQIFSVSTSCRVCRNRSTASSALQTGKPAYFHTGICHPQPLQTKLRIHISDLNQDLVNRHVSNDPQLLQTRLRIHISDLNLDLVNRHPSNYYSCKCGAVSKTIGHCPPCLLTLHSSTGLYHPNTYPALHYHTCVSERCP